MNKQEQQTTFLLKTNESQNPFLATYTHSSNPITIIEDDITFVCTSRPLSKYK